MGEMSPGDQLASALSGGGDTDGGGENVTAPPPVATPPQQPSSGGGHPAWDEYLADIPEALRGAVTPAFAKWDKKFQEQLQQVHSQYEPYKPFVDQRIDPNLLDQAWGLFNLMATDPRKLWDAMAEQYKFAAEQGQNGDGIEEIDLGTDPQYDLSKDPRFQQMEQTNQQILASMQQAQQQQEAMQMEAWVDQQIKGAEATLQQAGIPADDKAMRFITRSAMAYNDSNPDPRMADKNFQQAVQDYVDIVGGIRSQPRAGGNAPLVMPTNGGTPSNRVDTANMSDTDRRQLMVDMLNMQKRS